MATNPAFQHLNDRETFTKFILEGQPEPPRYFAIMKQWNKQPRPLLTKNYNIPALSAAEVEKALKKNVLIIDTRKKDEVAQGFIPGSLHIEGNKSFSTFVGSLVDYNQPIILITGKNQVEDLARKLMRIGMDHIYGYVENLYNFKGLKTSKIIQAEEVQVYLKQSNVQLIDVRTASEFESGHIKGFENIPLNKLEQESSKIRKDIPVIIHCQSGVRSAMAYSILERLGYSNILNYSGSINEWKTKNLPLVQ